MLHDFFRTGSAAFLITLLVSGCVHEGFSANNSGPDMRSYDQAQNVAVSAPETAPMAPAAQEDRRLPTLIVSNEAPPELAASVSSDAGYSATTEEDVEIGLPTFTTRHVETAVTRKANELDQELQQLQGNIDSAESRLKDLQVKNDRAVAEYYAAVASVSTELQSGSTPGNPILTERWTIAQKRLNTLSQDSGKLDALATELTTLASHANYLMDGTQSAFTISGAVREDHIHLTQIQDGVAQSVTQLNRLLTKVHDEINRRQTYLRNERANLETLALGVAKGELYGQNLTNSLFRKATGEAGQNMMKGAPKASSSATFTGVGSRRPLIIIRFDRPGVNYDQPLYTAISQALEKYPGAKFDLVAVSNLEGNAAQLALASAEARKNGEMVLRSLNQMGLPLERVRLTAANSKDVANSEVHIYLQ